MSKNFNALVNRMKKRCGDDNCNIFNRSYLFRLGDEGRYVLVTEEKVLEISGDLLEIDLRDYSKLLDCSEPSGEDLTASGQNKA